MTVVLEATGVQVTIGDTPILHGADLVARRGELVAVVGPNGAGKSTFARAVAGLQKRSAGTVQWLGEDLDSLRGRRLAKIRAFVPQRAQVPAGVTVRDAVMIGRSPHLSAFQRPGRHDVEMVERSLERAGVTDYSDRQLTTLSGGELQRVQVAVALAQDAPVLIADEPTAHLDLGATATVARLLRALAAQDLAVVLVVHDLGLAAAIADTVVVMSGGRTVAAGPPRDVLTAERISDVWQVEASLAGAEGGPTALSVDWLGGGASAQNVASSRDAAAAPDPIAPSM